MTIDAVSLAVAVVCSIGGATWALRSKLSDIEKAIVGEVAERTALAARVVKLEAVRKRR